MSSQKINMQRGDCQKNGAGTVCRFKGGGGGPWQEKGGGVFEGGLMS